MRLPRPPLSPWFRAPRTVNRTRLPRAARLGVAASVALFGVACSDRAPHPLAPDGGTVGDASGPPAWQENFDTADVSVVIRRTLSTRAPGAAAKTLRQTLALPRSLAPSIGATVVAPRFAPDSDAASRVMTVSLLRVSAPLVARDCRTEPEWRRELPMGGYLAVLRGRGSVPYTDIDISADGVPLGSVHAEWVRLPRSWVLRTQEFTSADRTVQERVTVTHFDEHGSAEARRVPMGGCDNVFLDGVRAGTKPQRTSMLALKDSAIAAASPVGGVPAAFAARRPGLEAFGLADAVSCDVSDETLEAGPCYEEKMALVTAGALLVTAGAVVATACPVPEPIVSKIACLKAISAWTVASAALATANYKLTECIRLARERAAECGCFDQLRAAPMSGPPGVASGGTEPAAAPVILSCTDGDGSGGGTTIPEPEPGTLYVQIAICTLVDHYDADGFYLYTTNAGCRYELAVI